MNASEVAVNAYIIYAFMGTIVLPLIALVGTVLRFTYVVGQLQGQITGLQTQIDGLREELNRVWEAIAGLRREMIDLFEQVEVRFEQVDVRIDRVDAHVIEVESGQGSFREAVAKNRGLLLGLHRKIDQIERHQHDAVTGNVILTPAEPEPVAD